VHSLLPKTNLREGIERNACSWNDFCVSSAEGEFALAKYSAQGRDVAVCALTSQGPRIQRERFFCTILRLLGRSRMRKEKSHPKRAHNASSALFTIVFLDGKNIDIARLWCRSVQPQENWRLLEVSIRVQGDYGGAPNYANQDRRRLVTLPRILQVGLTYIWRRACAWRWHLACAPTSVSNQDIESAGTNIVIG